MIVLQFGINVAAGKKKDIGFYHITFVRQLWITRSDGIYTIRKGSGKRNEERVCF